MSRKKSPPASEHPTVEVKDFGPIAKGKVELRPLTVFAGPSNTGKSWLATLIYAISRNSEQRLSLALLPKFEDRSNFPEDPTAWIKSIEEGTPIVLTSSEQQALKFILEGNALVLESEIRRCFGLSNSESLVRVGSGGSSTIRFQPAKDSVFVHYAYTMTVGADPSCAVELPEQPSIRATLFSKGTKDYVVSILRDLREVT